MRRGQLGRLICALGVAQIISWGSLFYSIAVLGESMRADLGVSGTWLFGAFTAGLVCSGLASPLVGRMIDTRGGWLVLSAGSLLSALALVLLSQAHGLLAPVHWLGARGRGNGGVPVRPGVRDAASACG